MFKVLGKWLVLIQTLVVVNNVLEYVKLVNLIYQLYFLLRNILAIIFKICYYKEYKEENKKGGSYENK